MTPIPFVNRGSNGTMTRIDMIRLMSSLSVLLSAVNLAGPTSGEPVDADHDQDERTGNCPEGHREFIGSSFFEYAGCMGNQSGDQHGGRVLNAVSGKACAAKTSHNEVDQAKDHLEIHQAAETCR